MMINTMIKRKVSESTLLWKLTSFSSDFHAQYSRGKGEQLEERFALDLESVSRSSIDCISFKFTVHDEKGVLCALHYASLSSLFYPSKRGKDVSLAIGEDTDSQYLLHLQVHSHAPDQVFVLQEQSKIFNPDYIKDTFFNYSFPVPAITPRHYRYISLLPEFWKILDEDMRNTHRSGNLGEWVQKVKYRFVRHYHKHSARHLATLQKSVNLWVELQNDLAVYSAARDNTLEQIYLDEDHLDKLTDVEQIKRDPFGVSLEGPNAENCAVVSYLFKRDRWDLNKEWRPFYNKIQEICRRGIPNYLRKIVWSELGRVCYFLKLTEKVLSSPDLTTSQFPSSNTSTPLSDSRKIYEVLKSQAIQEYYYLYQELEEDIDTLRERQGRSKLDYETPLRNICKTFIHWAQIFANLPYEPIRYYVNYSKTLITICQTLVIALSCSYLQEGVEIEEDVVFWLLISMTTYILSSYHETNEEALSVEILAADPALKKGRKNNKITTSALRCIQLRGIKGDLLLLKLLVKEKLPEVYEKFEEFGQPLEHYFADHMLTLFSTMFSPGMVFRIWDLVFLEGSSHNQVAALSLQTSLIVVVIVVVGEKPLHDHYDCLHTASEVWEATGDDEELC